MLRPVVVVCVPKVNPFPPNAYVDGFCNDDVAALVVNDDVTAEIAFDCASELPAAVNAVFASDVAVAAEPVAAFAVDCAAAAELVASFAVA